MGLGDYDVVVVGYGAKAQAIALKAIRLKARVALVTAHDQWDQNQLEQIIDQVRLKPNNLFSVLADLQPLEDFEFLQSLGVDVIFGEGEFSDRHTFVVKQINPTDTNKQVNRRILKFRRLVIVQDSLPPIRKVVGLNETNYLTYSSLFNLLINLSQTSSFEALPSVLSSLTILGGNALNCAIAQMLQGLGVKVQILAESHILPEFDLDIAKILQAHLEVYNKIKILTGAIITGVSDQKIWVTTATATEAIQRVQGDQLLIPTFDCNPNLQFNLADIKVNDGGIIINSKLQTTNPHIYLCRNFSDIDLILKNCLYWAIASTQLLSSASICLTNPEVAIIGKTEIEARLQYGQDLYVLQSFDQGLNQTDNSADDFQFYKILYRGNGEIVGAHFIGDRAQELMASMAILLQKRIKVTDLKRIENGAIAQIYQEISSIIWTKNWKSFWFRLFS